MLRNIVVAVALFGLKNINANQECMKRVLIIHGS